MVVMNWIFNAIGIILLAAVIRTIWTKNASAEMQAAFKL